ncbi:MAG: subtilase-type protease inhibitor [Tomitella sp.]|nr:subtilase-type protease inhibitor [Tomitella sp.]
MNTITRTVIGAAGAALLGAGAFAGTAAAQPEAPPPPSFGAFFLTSNDNAAGLLCSPDVGTHPDPVKACDSIRTAGGDFEALPNEEHMMCPMIYKPSPASALGVWIDQNGLQVVNYSHTYGNDCTASVSSGGVFGF